jgi:hypothetical protein
VRLADLATTQAKAFAMLGRHTEAQQAPQTANRHADAAPSGDTHSFWGAGQLHFAQSWVYAASGQETRADQAPARWCCAPFRWTTNTAPPSPTCATSS